MLLDAGVSLSLSLSFSFRQRAKRAALPAVPLLVVLSPASEASGSRRCTAARCPFASERSERFSPLHRCSLSFRQRAKRAALAAAPPLFLVSPASCKFIVVCVPQNKHRSVIQSSFASSETHIHITENFPSKRKQFTPAKWGASRQHVVSGPMSTHRRVVV